MDRILSNSSRSCGNEACQQRSRTSTLFEAHLSIFYHYGSLPRSPPTPDNNIWLFTLAALPFFFNIYLLTLQGRQCTVALSELFREIAAYRCRYGQQNTKKMSQERLKAKRVGRYFCMILALWATSFTLHRVISCSVNVKEYALMLVNNQEKAAAAIRLI